MTKIQMKKITTVALMLACSTLSMAQETSNAQASGERMQISLPQAVEQALQYSKTLQNSKMDLDIYQEKIKEARANFLPQASAKVAGQTYFGAESPFAGISSSMGSVFQPITDVLGALMSKHPDIVLPPQEPSDDSDSGDSKMKNSITLGATVNETFAMQAIKGYQIQKLAANLMETQYQNDVLSTKKNIIDTYYAILVYERNKEIITKNLTEMKEIRRQTTNIFNHGWAEKMDTLQMAVNVMNLENAIISLERNIESTKRALVLLMGLPITTQLDCKDNLNDYLTDSAVASMRQATTNGSTLSLDNSLDYKLVEQNIEISDETIKLQKYGWIPTLTATYQYSNAVVGGFMNFDHIGILTLSIPIFDGGTKASKTRQAKMEAAKARNNLALIQDKLLQNEEQYKYELRSSLDAYELQTTNLKVATEVLQQYKIKYDAGKLSSLDLTQANMNYLSAESSYAEACMNLVMAQTKLLKLYNAL